ncbi:MAG TPA: hypothetical protein VHN98_03480 [Acidimicrobiales bacterium]|nr:hypothetical protein [Acidimicrobiales bacterium]
MRQVVAVLVGVAVAVVGAVVLGEYDLSGRTALLAGLLFGVALAEVMAGVARTADVAMSAAAGLLAEAGLVWALWISTGHRLDLASATGWAGVALGTVAAATWLRSAGRRGARTPTSP